MSAKRFVCRGICAVLVVAVSMGLTGGIASAGTARPADEVAETGYSFAPLSPGKDHFTYTVQADGDALLLKVSPEVHFSMRGNSAILRSGNATIETLPLAAPSDKHGTVGLQYELVSPSVIRVTPSSHNQILGGKVVPYGWWKNWGKCAAGVVGGASTGATTGGLGGAAVGTVTVPIVGSVPGAAIGAVGGGIGGGLTGAVAAC